jgi:hypothetical protein
VALKWPPRYSAPYPRKYIRFAIFDFWTNTKNVQLAKNEELRPERICSTIFFVVDISPLLMKLKPYEMRS